MSRRRNDILGRVRARGLKLGKSNALITGILRGTLTYDTASLIDAAGATTGSMTVTGAALGDFVIVSLGVDLEGITVTGYVDAANSVKVRIQNESTATVDLASTTVRALVIKASAA